MLNYHLKQRSSPPDGFVPICFKNHVQDSRVRLLYYYTLKFCHVGYDGFNKALTGDTSMTVTAKRSDPHLVPCVISLAREADGTASFWRCRIAVKRGPSVSRNGSSKSTRDDS